jgi:hypothetical protein
MKKSTSFLRDTLIRIVSTGSNDLRGTYIHPDLQVIFGIWISDDFALQVSRWIRELLVTGKVELGDEKTITELQNE